MKKTFQVNINNKIFHIDEDAYELLQSYLSQLRSTFPGEDGREIVEDIETRISEHFDKRILTGVSVIVLEDVNNVIGIVGRPEEIVEDSDFVPSEAGAAAESSASGESAVPPPFIGHGSQESGAATGPGQQETARKKYFRDVRHKVFGGVLAGLAQYFGWDVTILRILVVAGTVALGKFELFWPMVFIYLVCWMIFPAARTPRDILEMKGEPVTLDNIGQTVIDSSVPPSAPVPHDDGNSFVRFINNFFLIAARILLVFFGAVGGIVAVTMLILSLVCVVGICCLYFGNMPDVLNMFDIHTGSPYLMGWGLVFLFLAIMVPALCLAWAGIVTLFKAPKISTQSGIAILIIEIILIVIAASLGSFAMAH